MIRLWTLEKYDKLHEKSQLIGRILSRHPFPSRAVPNGRSRSAAKEASPVTGPKASPAATVNPSTGGTPGDSMAASLTPVTSIEIFQWSIERASNLLKIHGAAHGKRSKPEKHLADAHRAAIVLAISALDAFIRSFVVSEIQALLATRRASLPGELAAKIKSFLKDDGLLDAARNDDLLERVGKAFRKDFEKRSFQGVSQITESLKLLGHEDVFHEIAGNSGTNEDGLKIKLDEFTNRRHVIAHRGDYDLAQNPPRELPITKRHVEECIKIVTLIATEIHKLGRSK